MAQMLTRSLPMRWILYSWHTIGGQSLNGNIRPTPSSLSGRISSLYLRQQLSSDCTSRFTSQPSYYCECGHQTRRRNGVQQQQRRPYYYEFIKRMTGVSEKVRNFVVKGMVCPPCTPFKENGDLNLDMIPAYAHHLKSFGVPNAFITGSIGEGNNMMVEERKLVGEAWVKAASGVLSAVIIHIGAGNLRESQELARHAQSIGADAIACVGPTYFKPASMEQYVKYMREVAAAAPDVPFYLYDIDFVTGIPFRADAFFREAAPQIPTLRGLKHTSPNLGSMNNILVEHSGKYQILMGTDDYFLGGLVIGLEVTIGSSYLGNVHNRMKEAFDCGDIQAARMEQNRALSTVNLYAKYGLSSAAATKTVMRLLGLDMGQPRCPLAPVSNEVVDKLKDDLIDLGFFEWATKK